MNIYQKAIRYTKPLVEIDEKIDHLDEMMTTTGMYTQVATDPGQEGIPPTFGKATLNSFVNCQTDWDSDAQGDGSVINHNLSQLQTTDAEGNIKSILKPFDIPTQSDGSEYVGTPYGVALSASMALTGTSLGYINENGYNHVYQLGNVFGVTYSEFALKFAAAYENGGPYVDKTIYLWSSLDCLLGQCRGGAAYYPSDRDNESNPKAERALYAYTLRIPTYSDGVPVSNEIMTDAGQPAKPRSVSSVVSRNNLGDPNYYPGPVQNIINIVNNVTDFGNNLINFISGSGGGNTPPPPPEDNPLPPPPPPPEDNPLPPPPPPPEDDNDDRPLIPLGYDENGDPTGFTRLSDNALDQFIDGGGDAAIREGKTLTQVMQQGADNRKNAFTDFTSGIGDGMTVLSQVQDTLAVNQALNNIDPPASEGERPTIKEGERGSSTNPVQTNLSDSSMNALQNAVNTYDSSIDGDLTTYLNKFTSTSDNLGLKSTHNNIQGTEIRGDDIIIKDTHGFGPSADIYNKPVVKQVSDTAEVIVNALGLDGKEASEQVQTIFDQLGPVGEFAGRVASGGERGLAGKNDPVVHFETVIPGGAKNLGSNFQPMKEETLFEKWKKKDQKKSESKPNQLKLTYNYFYYLPTVVKKMIIMDFKVELEIMNLPKEEKSYREKELRNTLINKHHEIYMDAKFPENKEQTLRVKKILTRNIELSDPKTFKDPKPVLTYGKVFGDDPKGKKVKEKDFNKKSPGRFLRTEKKVDRSRTRWLKG